jgi:hypothetical protein
VRVSFSTAAMKASNQTLSSVIKQDNPRSHYQLCPLFDVVMVFCDNAQTNYLHLLSLYPLTIHDHPFISFSSGRDETCVQNFDCENECGGSE